MGRRLGARRMVLAADVEQGHRADSARLCAEERSLTAAHAQDVRRTGLTRLCHSVPRGGTRTFAPSIRAALIAGRNSHVVAPRASLCSPHSAVVPRKSALSAGFTLPCQ